MKIEIESKFDEKLGYFVAESKVSVLDMVSTATASDESTAIHMALELVKDELEYNGFIELAQH